MNVNGLGGQDARVLPVAVAARPPAPRLRSDEAVPPALVPNERAAVPEPSEDTIKRADSASEQAPGPKPTGTRLRVDPETKRIVAQIVDENGEVIRQLPPEELLELSVRFKRLEGLLFNRET
jgi:hypothetical protein